jgi:hypothetical protein
MPQFKALACAACQKVIRGIMFYCSRPHCDDDRPLGRGEFVCESCYRKPCHKRSHMIKTYKHSILHSVIDPEVSSKICRCSSVPHVDPDGGLASLFPVDPKMKHRVSGGARCGLFCLGDRITEGKLEGQTIQVDRNKQNDEDEDRVQHSRPQRRGKMIRVSGTTGASTEQEGTVDDELDGGVPAYLRAQIKKVPFGNVHVSLMVGPLIIENGVPG